MLVCAINSVCFLFPNSVYPVLARICRKRRKRLQTAKRNRDFSDDTVSTEGMRVYTPKGPVPRVKVSLLILFTCLHIVKAQNLLFSSRPLTFGLKLPYVVFLHSGCDSQSSETHRLLSRAQH